MVAKRKKKYDAGEAARFVTRKQALHKLQLNLKVSKRGPVLYFLFNMWYIVGKLLLI